MISESEFTVQGHGVHTAYKEITEALAARGDVDIKVNTKRTADVVHIQTVGIYGLIRLLRGRAKKVVSAHLVPDSFVGSIKGARYWKPLARWWLKFFYGRADLVLGCSGMVRDELVNNMMLDNVDVLYNTVNMARYRATPAEKAAARETLAIGADEFVVIGNGQVQPRKRVDVLMNMARSMPEARFFWIGGIPFKNLGANHAAMQQLIDATPDNLTVTGVLALADVRAYYLAADVFVLPATQENHPMCVLEASGAGLPIVLRKIPQYADTFADDAILAASDDEFADAVARLRADPAYYQQAVRGADRIAQRFDSATGAQRLVDFYQTLLS